MNNINIKQKQLSSEALWEKIEEIYGKVPELIKKVLQINGFDTFLALKGIRYDDKIEFFDSLETTIRDLVTSDMENEDKLDLCELLSGYCDLTKFKLKPGHKNFIMNLMKEIDSADPNEFFKSTHPIKSPEQVTIVKVPTASPTPVEIKYEVHNEFSEEMDNEQYDYHPHEQIFIQDQQTEDMIEQELPEEEYILEEYLSDDQQRAIQGYVLTIEPKEKRKKTTRRVHRKPERMYNEEFLQTHANPRKRRVTTSKFYPNTDEGTKERFRDLIKQSMECILTKEQHASIENQSIDIEKQSDSCYSVLCPLCKASIKLAVVYENNGKYVNYKRSNFERHLRYKHCKTVRKLIN